MVAIKNVNYKAAELVYSWLGFSQIACSKPKNDTLSGMLHMQSSVYCIHLSDWRTIKSRAETNI